MQEFVELMFKKVRDLMDEIDKAQNSGILDNNPYEHHVPDMLFNIRALLNVVSTLELLRQAMEKIECESDGTK